MKSAMEKLLANAGKKETALTNTSEPILNEGVKPAELELPEKGPSEVTNNSSLSENDYEGKKGKKNSESIGKKPYKEFMESSWEKNKKPAMSTMNVPTDILEFFGSLATSENTYSYMLVYNILKDWKANYKNDWQESMKKKLKGFDD